MANSLIIPPYRAALLTNADGSPVVREDSSNGPIATERQWYMFWRQLGEQVNTVAQQIDGLEGLVTYGNHLDRPDGQFQHDGALYVEQDRGSVLYQNQGGVWQYIAGIMYGTLAPDQRPTDLGPSADVGFQFRTTTDPARAFAWNGGQWVETTPVRYGTHAERLAEVIANLVSGMLWAETDRSDVLYQNQGGVWQYLTGTMYGTLSPDQRPTDLGPSADAGFIFKTNSDPSRAFAWNGGQWIETTPVRYGTHAERLAEVIANLVSGMLWMETDRGNVTYQLQGGVWLYLSGEMWGTLSPDQRPTDLGVNDTGFHFIVTVSPIREFIWSSSAWVEVTAQTNTVQVAHAGAVLTLTTTMQAVPNCSLTLVKAGTYLVLGVFDFINVSDASNYFLGAVTGQSWDAVFMTPATSGRATVSQQWLVTATAGQVVQLLASKTGGAGSSQAADHTSISALWVSP